MAVDEEGVRVTHENGETVVSVPANTAYAALPFRIDVDSEAEAREVLLDLSNAVAGYVEGSEKVAIVGGPEAIFALKVTLDTALAEAGARLEAHGFEVDPEAMADHMRCESAARRGIAPGELLDWEQLQDSERQGWRDQADIALAYIGPVS